jgi:hypothetical protein
MKCLATLLVVMGSVAARPAANAALQIEEQSVNGGTLTVFKMTVTPAPEPVPALRHRLVLREIDEKAGNAATMYYRAIMATQQTTKQLIDTYGKEYDDFPWPEKSMSMDRLRRAVSIIDGGPFMTSLREAAARRDCDWGFDLQSIRGPELYSFLLPEIQEARQLSWFLSLRARLAVEEGRYDDAIDDLRINFKLAGDVAAEPLIVSGLVGIAQASIGNQVLCRLIAAPNSPNMYWALTELPDPLVELRGAVRFEMSSFLRVFPFLRDAESQEHSPEEWSRQLAHALSELGPLTGGSDSLGNETVRRLAVTGLALAAYTPAKQRLKEQGFDAARIERMPVGQVIAIDAAGEFRRVADEFEKWWYLNARVATQRIERIEDRLGENKLEGGFGRAVAAILLPAVNAARLAQERHQWQTGALRVVEAIRMHAAETGRLPEKLDEITVVPVPINRATGEAYQYKLDGETAVLDLPFSDGYPSVAWRFEIQLAD